jgi:hypothetical protein
MFTTPILTTEMKLDFSEAPRNYYYITTFLPNLCIFVYIIKVDTTPANPSKTTQLKPIFMFAALGFVDEEGLEVDEVELPVPLDVLDGDVPVETLELANG